MDLKVYYLSTCDTCKRILKSVDLPTNAKLQDVKKEHIDKSDLAELRKYVSSYKDLLNTRAQKLRQEKITVEGMSESSLEKLILSHYSFLKRPVFLFDDRAFIGNSKNNVAQLSDYLS